MRVRITFVLLALAAGLAPAASSALSRNCTPVEQPQKVCVFENLTSQNEPEVCVENKGWVTGDSCAQRVKSGPIEVYHACLQGKAAPVSTSAYVCAATVRTGGDGNTHAYVGVDSDPLNLCRRGVAGGTNGRTPTYTVTPC